MTSNSHRIVIISTLFVIFMSSSQAGIKCWKNSDGYRECGDYIPPEYAQQESKKFNKHGVTTEKKRAAKTQEELAEIKRLADIESEKQAKIQEREDSDRVLLNSFASADDIILAREGKLSSLAAEISLRQTQIEKLQMNLDKIVTVAADMERRGVPLTEKVLADVENVKSQIAETKTYLKAKYKEQVLVKQQYDQDLNRYNKLQSDADYQASAE
ncbi:MAG: hypothetical protein AB8D52_10615 [Gammaproteobacteria bacterium]